VPLHLLIEVKYRSKDALAAAVTMLLTFPPPPYDVFERAHPTVPWMAAAGTGRGRE
jgi:hypothetical protein